MGSYAVYGGTGAAAAYVKSNAPDALTLRVEEVTEVLDEASSVASESWLRILQYDWVQVVDGRLYIGEISALDLGSMILIVFSVAATMFKAYYDFTDWRERRQARIKARKASRERVNENASTLGGGDPPPS